MPRTPTATYRIQVHAKFTLADVRRIVPYLDALGVSDVYLSPITQARAGSEHGYDVTDPTRLNPEIGTDADLDALSSDLSARGMGLLVDIVPNHMAASTENPWWLDVLQSGQGSPYAQLFDIDWHPAALKGGLRGKLLVPILGGSYGQVLESGELSVGVEPTGLFVRYWDHRIPLAPRSYALALGPAHGALAAAWGPDHPVVRRFGELLENAQRLPARSDPDEPPTLSWLRDRANVTHGLLALFRENPDARDVVQQALDDARGTPGEPESFDHLDRVLAAQNYWLAFWRLALQEINYRRFFNITDLVAVRVENPEVMTATHEYVLRLARERKITGFRIDHIDGLWDPLQYLRRLQQRVGATPYGPPRRRRPGFYVVVEKILARDEPLPREWACAGATGYEFTGLLNELLVDQRGLAELQAIYARHTGQPEVAAEIRYDKKKLVMERLFGSEVRTLADQLGRLASLDRYGRDIPQAELQHALVEVTACLPVYRTYVRDEQVPERDRAYLLAALDAARARVGDDQVSAAAFRFLHRVLLQEPMRGLGGLRRARVQFLMRWQQFTGAVMAKGLEDTTFYLYNRLMSLNEVGGDPGFDEAEDALLRFHRFNADRQAHWPGALNATSTHDTKRSEDVRARIHVLSEMPDEWGRALERWSETTAPLKTQVHGRPAPGPNQEVLLFQTLLGAWPFDEAELPLFRERIKQYLLKAAREGAVRTSWIAPDEEHEAALAHFVDGLFDAERSAAFLRDFRAFQQRLCWPGAMNALAQVLLKTTAPGVPDVYQGMEFWDFSLVDPDNRRPVDYDARRRALEELPGAEDVTPEHVARWAERYEDARIKMHVTRTALRFRRAHAALFDDGDYVPLQVTGPRAGNVVAYARRLEREWAVVATARAFHRLSGGERRVPDGAWGSTVIVLPSGAPSEWTDLLVNAPADLGPDRTSLDVSRLFATVPMCLLSSG